MEEIKEKIKAFFSSNDIEMKLLGRILCHQYRINYSVLIGRKDNKARKPVNFSLHSHIFKGNNYYYEYYDSFNLIEIKFNKHGKRVKEDKEEIRDS